MNLRFLNFDFRFEMFPVNPEPHLTPALSPISWRRGRSVGTPWKFIYLGLHSALGFQSEIENRNSKIS